MGQTGAGGTAIGQVEAEVGQGVLGALIGQGEAYARQGCFWGTVIGQGQAEVGQGGVGWGDEMCGSFQSLILSVLVSSFLN